MFRQSQMPSPPASTLSIRSSQSSSTSLHTSVTGMQPGPVELDSPVVLVLLPSVVLVLVPPVVLVPSVVLVLSLVEPTPWVVPSVEVGSLVVEVEPLTESPPVLVALVVGPDVVGAPVESPPVLVVAELEAVVDSVAESPSVEQAASRRPRLAIRCK